MSQRAINWAIVGILALAIGATYLVQAGTEREEAKERAHIAYIAHPDPYTYNDYRQFHRAYSLGEVKGASKYYLYAYLAKNGEYINAADCADHALGDCLAVTLYVADAHTDQAARARLYDIRGHFGCFELLASDYRNGVLLLDAFTGQCEGI